mmetsp:Transcript_9061/g.17754  ORF Transcript_9061/g.17754 Transcript_9061/m.17754 type:complete len:111 (+) Transcript_9061:190-522(+)
MAERHSVLPSYLFMYPASHPPNSSSCTFHSRSSFRLPTCVPYFPSILSSKLHRSYLACDSATFCTKLQTSIATAKFIAFVSNDTEASAFSWSDHPELNLKEWSPSLATSK